MQLLTSHILTLGLGVLMVLITATLYPSVTDGGLEQGWRWSS
jgi:hypothetical protein